MNSFLTGLFSLRDSHIDCPLSFAGRGIVISAGGPFLPSAYIAVRSIREVGCRLPIQLWHLGVAELPEVFRPPFADLGVEFVDSLEVRRVHPMRNLAGWENKPFAIVHSPFEEVLLVDADNLLLADASLLFESPIYKDCGSLFWPDFYSEEQLFWTIRPGAWELLGLKSERGAEIESGQLLINKRKCWKALILALYMNSNSDYFYKFCSHGDKDTFTLSWKLAGLPMGVTPHRPQMTTEPVRIHFTPEGRELFQHSRKWAFPAQRNARLPQFLKEEICLQWLRELEALI